MLVCTGTGGWYYGWNPEKSLDWYIANSRLNAVELNASFYRFPFHNQITSWVRKGSGLSWAVKVHRSVTHTHRFNEQGLSVWERFREAFRILDPYVAFYLFQAPPSFTGIDRLIRFSGDADLGERFAFEIRNPALLGDDAACRRLQDHVTLVSVDSPDHANRIFAGDAIYLRMHGREEWYRYEYSWEELGETADLIRAAGPKRVHVFFNDDQAMLGNARIMRELLGG
jgi:uncharacterized protein YecE (DUF72 family)